MNKYDYMKDIMEWGSLHGSQADIANIKLPKWMRKKGGKNNSTKKYR